MTSQVAKGGGDRLIYHITLSLSDDNTENKCLFYILTGDWVWC